MDDDTIQTTRSVLGNASRVEKQAPLLEVAAKQSQILADLADCARRLADRVSGEISTGNQEAELRPEGLNLRDLQRADGRSLSKLEANLVRLQEGLN